MIYKRYYIPSGATTSAGGTVKAAGASYALNGVALAREGDPVDCPACATEGRIQCIGPRLSTRCNGKEFALSEDLCICNCDPPPRLLASQFSEFQVVSASPSAPGS